MRDFQQNLIDLLYPDFNYKTKTFVSRVQLRTDVREVFSTSSLTTFDCCFDTTCKCVLVDQSLYVCVNVNMQYHAYIRYPFKCHIINLVF